ncbi:MAG: hypothetical protein MJ003_06245 [Paludibacteraceae bacterium]|nr:hypothetical protein [Paludibacteraceae bacterium]
MKKIIFTLSLLCISACMFAYYDYWNGQLSSGGSYVNDMMAEMPYISNEYAVIEKQYITDGRLKVSTSLTLGWHNFFRRLALNYYWADWIISDFQYTRHVYYSSKNNDNYSEITSLAITSGRIDVSAYSLCATDVVKVNNYSSQYNTYVFSEDMMADVRSLTKNNDFKLKIVYTFKPVPYSKHDGYHYDPNETERYIQTHTISITKNPSASQLVFKVAQVNGSSQINVNGTSNPYYDTGSGAKYLVYNDPAAVIAVIADTVNLPCKKTTVAGTSVSAFYGYGTFLASIGSTSSPTEAGPSEFHEVGCGFTRPTCSRDCNGTTSPYLDFLSDNAVHKVFLSQKGYDVSTECYKRRTNILLRSQNAEMTSFDENTIEDFDLFKRTENRMSRIFHLRDIDNVNKYQGIRYGANTIIKIMHSALYTNKINLVSNPKEKSFFSLAYLRYGPPYDYYIASGSDITSNIIEFEIVSEVSLPKLSANEKLVRQTCVSDSLTREGDFIHLTGKEIVCGNYSPSLYSPEYYWEVSFDGVKWEMLTTKNYSKYIVNRYNIAYAVVMDEKKDLLLKSTILMNKEQAMFRQKVVLKSFSAPEYSTLYNFEGENGRWYITVSADDYYTYIPTPLLSDDNFAFSPLSFPQVQRLCKGDELQSNKISFRLKNSKNVTTEQINRLSEIADYKIYELINDSVGRLVSTTSSYTMNWNGNDLGYRCVISWCRDSLYKDVHVYAHPVEYISTDSISSSVVICGKDDKKGTVSLLCQQGTVPEITVNVKDTDNCLYFMKVESNDGKDNGWKNFIEGNSTILTNEDSNGKFDVFYIKKISEETGCESDSVKITVTYFEGIENNIISFASEKEYLPGTTYIVKNHASPAIKGQIIKGGYGTPSAVNKNVYIYKYIYKDESDVWQNLGEEIVVSGDDNKSVSLPEGAFNVDRQYNLARIVISRNGDDYSTQVSDTSNILTIKVIEEISPDNVLVVGDGECAGTKVTVAVAGYDPIDEEKGHIQFVWSVDDDSLTMFTSGEMNEICDIYNSTKDFKVEVFRLDTVINVASPTIIRDIEVLTITPSFSLTTGENKENIFAYPDEKFWFQSGTRFVLNNQTEGADSYLWNLELQYYTGSEVEGLKSYKENPVCYLYNPGQNKIRLTAKNSKGCEASITAENIYIQSASVRDVMAMSYFEPEDNVFINQKGINEFEVYPTITNGGIVKVLYSGGKFTYSVINVVNQNVLSGESDYVANIDFSMMPAGGYLLYLSSVSPDETEENVIVKILRR